MTPDCLVSLRATARLPRLLQIESRRGWRGSRSNSSTSECLNFTAQNATVGGQLLALHGAPPAAGCLTYGGYSEANTGVAVCSGWSAQGTGGQLWVLQREKAGPAGCGSWRLALDKSCRAGKELASTRGRSIEVCSASGADCSDAVFDCTPETLRWCRWSRRRRTISVYLQTDSGSAGNELCIVKRAARPPPPPPPRPPIGRAARRRRRLEHSMQRHRCLSGVSDLLQDGRRQLVGAVRLRYASHPRDSDRLGRHPAPCLSR